MKTAPSWHRSLAPAGRWLSMLLGGLVLGCPGYFYSSRAYFANTTREPVKVRVQTLLADVACDKVQGRSAEVLAHRELFGNAVSYDVAGGEALPLDLDPVDHGVWSGAPRSSCAAIVQVLGFPDQLVFWAPDAVSASTESKMAQADDAEFLAQSLRLEGHGELKGLAAGMGLEVTPLPPLASGGAADSDAPVALGWSGTPAPGTNLVLLRRDKLPDGCWSLELGKAASSGWPLFLCAPDWSFPFELGDELSVQLEMLPRSDVYNSPDAQASSTEWGTALSTRSGDGDRALYDLGGAPVLSWAPAKGRVSLFVFAPVSFSWSSAPARAKRQVVLESMDVGTGYRVGLGLGMLVRLSSGLGLLVELEASRQQVSHVRRYARLDGSGPEVELPIGYDLRWLGLELGLAFFP